MDENASDVIQVKFLNILGNVLQKGNDETVLQSVFDGNLCCNILMRMSRKDYPTHDAMQIAARVLTMFFEIGIVSSSPSPSKKKTKITFRF
jgi:hypothetical protein